MKKEITDIKKLNRTRCITGLVVSILMVSLVFVALTLNLINYYNESSPEAGSGTMRMFTTLSNIIVAIGSLLIIPYSIDGLRKNNYHLPIWIVDILYIGTFCVALTFLVASTIISIAQGFYTSMFYNSNIFFHLINPICAIVLFTFVNSDHNISFKKSFIPLIPVTLYGIVYVIMAILIGEANGGWRDVYEFNTFMPWPITIILIALVSFGISNLIRYLHNLNHKHFKEAVRRYYLESEDYNVPTIEDAIRILAKKEKEDYSSGNTEIPTRIIEMFKERFNSDIPTSELSKLFINDYFE